MTRMAERLREKTKTIQGTRLQQLLKTPTTPKPKIPIIPLFKPSFAKAVVKSMQGKPEKWESFGVRFGKEKSLGKFETETGASKSLMKFLKGTLGASGGLKRGGMKLKAAELKGFGGGEFKLSKTSPYKIVQKERFRLGKGRMEPQTREIQMFKKQSPSKKKKKKGSIWDF